MKTGPSGAIAQRFLNSKLTPLLTAASLVLGIGAVMSTPREEEPQIRVPMIDVAVGLPGASPREVERRLVAAPHNRMARWSPHDSRSAPNPKSPSLGCTAS
jgi:hypothetical protein